VGEQWEATGSHVTGRDVTGSQSNYQIIKQQLIPMWPPTISENHTEQLARYRWPQNKSNDNIVLIYICEKTTYQEYTSI
jgi:hypothetical protein